LGLLICSVDLSSHRVPLHYPSRELVEAESFRSLPVLVFLALPQNMTAPQGIVRRHLGKTHSREDLQKCLPLGQAAIQVISLGCCLEQALSLQESEKLWILRRQSQLAPQCSKDPGSPGALLVLRQVSRITTHSAAIGSQPGSDRHLLRKWQTDETALYWSCLTSIVEAGVNKIRWEPYWRLR